MNKLSKSKDEIEAYIETFENLASLANEDSSLICIDTRIPQKYNNALSKLAAKFDEVKIPLESLRQSVLETIHELNDS